MRRHPHPHPNPDRDPDPDPNLTPDPGQVPDEAAVLTVNTASVTLAKPLVAEERIEATATVSLSEWAQKPNRTA